MSANRMLWFFAVEGMNIIRRYLVTAFCEALAEMLARVKSVSLCDFLELVVEGAGNVGPQENALVLIGAPGGGARIKVFAT